MVGVVTKTLLVSLAIMAVTVSVNGQGYGASGPISRVRLTSGEEFTKVDSDLSDPSLAGINWHDREMWGLFTCVGEVISRGNVQILFMNETTCYMTDQVISNLPVSCSSADSESYFGMYQVQA